jgi:CheY-like chemotaxis protein
VIAGSSGNAPAAPITARQISGAVDTRGTRLVMLAPMSAPAGGEDAGAWARAARRTTPLTEEDLRQAILEALGAHDDPLAPGDPGQNPGDTTPLHVLLAEDCLVNREVAVGLLELRGHRVRVVESGHDAVEAVRLNTFDVVLMDVEMPDMDGLEATRIIRRWEADQGRHTPIIAMTAHAAAAYHDACLEAGMDDHISKPISSESFYHAVERWAERARQPQLAAASHADRRA